MLTFPIPKRYDLLYTYTIVGVCLYNFFILYRYTLFKENNSMIKIVFSTVMRILSML